MKFNDTAPVIKDVVGPPPWLKNLAEDATVQGVVLKQPITGKADILAVLKAAIPLYDYQHFSYRQNLSDDFFMESYRAKIQGVDVECAVWVHRNQAGETDSVMINHYPLPAALLFSRLMWENVDEQYRALYLSPAEYEAITAAAHPHDRPV